MLGSSLAERTALHRWCFVTTARYSCMAQLAYSSTIACRTGVAACSHSLTLLKSVMEWSILAAQAYIASGAGKQHAHPTNQASESAVASAPEAVQPAKPLQDIRRNLAEKYDDANTRVRNFPKNTLDSACSVTSICSPQRVRT